MSLSLVGESQVFLIAACPHISPKRTKYYYKSLIVDRDSVISIATLHGLDDPGIESGVGEIFETRPGRPWGPSRFLYNAYRVSVPGVERLGRGVDHPPHLAPRLKKE
jgi:hypothetical protein